ncbi:putative proteasome subunit alpha type-5 [Zancudomyces culisetae]|uniref:Putative proteasome subunit alpha type-5 n=1 Tax=Zancudomyces culisetae TaxID=1213189 RepID=A0A1R1PK41_ZANCU|nr:putative proteasome subunit alpha type-5 [Zancudomyces culisetae]|eukprot:OMH81324.1 putative proteasome subunit alpha type-5 [Zancudomyces culisetae]
MSRPFGVSLLVAGVDDIKGPQLFVTDPSGSLVRYEAKAIGAGSEGAQAELQQSYYKNMSLAEAEVLTLKVIKQVMEEKLSSKNVQLAKVAKDEKTGAAQFKIYSSQDLEPIIERLAEQD